MKIVDFVGPELIVPQLQAHEKSAVIRELADHLAAHVSGPQKIDREVLAKVLLERERLASTAIGEGVAIPHGKLDAVGKLVAVVGRAPEGVDFDSMDGRPTHLFFVLVAPENSTGVHLKALARISRLFKDPEFRTRLMQAKDAAEIFKVIADEDAKY
ncbi:MAG TPA: PTS sugar transporter subunit IIA [Polyangia bacterium]|jgi:PTS system nitrogen regulatory IIA component|nr:PTS sugar transporter subunit IIA [Polyangia bacterium]